MYLITYTAIYIQARYEGIIIYTGRFERIYVQEIIPISEIFAQYCMYIYGLYMLGSKIFHNLTIISC